MKLRSYLFLQNHTPYKINFEQIEKNNTAYNQNPYFCRFKLITK